MRTYSIVDRLMWENIHKDVRRNPGVYTLRCRDSQSGDNTVIPVPRLAKADDSGILYIGAASVLCDRIASLKKAVCAAFKYGDYSAPNGHPAGAHFEKFPLLRLKFPVESLVVTIDSFEPDSNDLDRHFKLGNDALAAYGEAYGELPPFNLKSGGKNLVDLPPPR